jgi:hypothetical protein
MKNLILQIEEAALNAWPAIHQTFFDGWVLRFSMGYTKRANSVNPLYTSTLDLEVKVEDCEDIYGRQGLPPIFRITSLAADELDSVLERRGYRKIDLTHVMVLDLTQKKFPEPEEVELRQLPLEQWMGVYSSVSGSVVGKQPGHAEILQGILNPHLMAALEKSGQWLTCGLGVLERNLFGLFDIVTHADFRNQGLGTHLIEGMLDWAKSQGATVAYLQVMDVNTPARRLYQRLGFEDVYSYWYRVPGGE